MPPNKPAAPDLRQAIRARMHELAISQESLATTTAANGAKVSPAMLRLFLNQRKPMSIDRVESVCKALRLRLVIVADAMEAAAG